MSWSCLTQARCASFFFVARRCSSSCKCLWRDHGKKAPEGSNFNSIDGAASPRRRPSPPPHGMPPPPPQATPLVPANSHTSSGLSFQQTVIRHPRNCPPQARPRALANGGRAGAHGNTRQGTTGAGGGTPDAQTAIAMEGGAADRNHSGEGQGGTHTTGNHRGEGGYHGVGGGGGA